MNDWLDKLHKARRDTQTLSGILRDEARALSVPFGNAPIVTSLYSYADMLEEISRRINEATGEVADKIVMSSLDSSANMLKATLAVMMVNECNDG